MCAGRVGSSDDYTYCTLRSIHSCTRDSIELTCTFYFHMVSCIVTCVASGFHRLTQFHSHHYYNNKGLGERTVRVDGRTHSWRTQEESQCTRDLMDEFVGKIGRVRACSVGYGKESINGLRPPSGPSLCKWITMKFLFCTFFRFFYHHPFLTLPYVALAPQVPTKG